MPTSSGMLKLVVIGGAGRPAVERVQRSRASLRVDRRWPAGSTCRRSDPGKEQSIGWGIAPVARLKSALKSSVAGAGTPRHRVVAEQPPSASAAERGNSGPEQPVPGLEHLSFPSVWTARNIALNYSTGRSLRSPADAAQQSKGSCGQGRFANATNASGRIPATSPRNIPHGWPRRSTHHRRRVARS